MNVCINLNKLESTLKVGVTSLIESKEYAIYSEQQDGRNELFFSDNYEKGFEIVSVNNGYEIHYHELSDAYRAIAYLLAREDIESYCEEADFEFRCVQIDSSRNGVMTTENVKAFFRRFALMGINAACLYTEDVYDIEDEPFFGYLRGKYTKKELKELDDYAYNLGIELFPCIQTLGHLEQVLQWSNAYKNVTDTHHILLVGEEQTYKLIEKMVDSFSVLRSKRIHIGMDEAHGLGSGEYKKRHGERSSFDIINEHLKKVVEICKSKALNPMIWSDMYFRLGSKTNDYYDLDTDIPQHVIDDIDPDIELVYWDYYHKEESFYKRFIDIHRRMNKEPIVAPATWTWTRFWCALPYSYDTISACLNASREKKIKRVFLTTWGDDGMEIDIYSSLPAIQLFAELCYTKTIDRNELAKNLQASSGIDLEAYERASDLDSCAKLTDTISTMSNISKWLLWDDPIIGLCEPQQAGHSFAKHYECLARDLYNYTNKQTPQNDRLEFPAQLAKVLSIKCDIRKKLVKAYMKQDHKMLEHLLELEVIPLINELRLLWKYHRKMWLNTYKPFGLEVIEIRYGGLIARFESLVDRLDDFMNGDITSIPEFETELKPFDNDSQDSLAHIHQYKRIATPSALF